jgi:hypothetical protein
MTYPNDPNFTYPDNPNFRRDVDGSSFTATTWASLAFIVLLFGAVAFWAYQSGDMEAASINRPGVERNGSPTTTGQGGAPSRMSAKDAAQ